MGSLVDALANPDKVGAVVNDSVQLLEEEVSSKKGVSGLGIKAGFKAVKSFKPGFLAAVIHHLLPEFTTALDPIYQEALADGGGIVPYFEKHAGRTLNYAQVADTDYKGARPRQLPRHAGKQLSLVVGPARAHHR